MPHFYDYIGEYLLNKGLITPAQLEEALKEKENSGGRVGEILVKKGFISETEVTKALSEQLGIPFIDLTHYTIEPEALKFFTPELARRYQAIPLSKVMDALTVAMVNPLDIMAVDEIKMACGLTIRPVFATPLSIKEAIEKFYGEEQKQPLETSSVPSELSLIHISEPTRPY